MNRTFWAGLTLILVALALLSCNFGGNSNSGAIGQSAASAGTLGSISGTVTDSKTGQPLPGVAVQVVSTTYGAITDPTGKYHIQNLAPGSYTVRATMIGYAFKTVTAVTVTAGNNTTQDFQLDQKFVEMQYQIVTQDRGFYTPQSSPPSHEVKSALDVPAIQEIGTGPAKTSSPSEQKCQIGLPPTSSEPVRTPRALLKCIMPTQYGNPPMANGGSVPPNGQAYDAMFFKHYGVNPFIPTEDDHLSTFAIDADNASYTMTRSYLTRGEIPPEEAVRVEEFVNNFKYQLQSPSRTRVPRQSGSGAVQVR